jgi:hypothetical protein
MDIQKESKLTDKEIMTKSDKPSLFDSKDRKILDHVCDEIVTQIETSKRMAAASYDPMIRDKHAAVAARFTGLLDFIRKLKLTEQYLEA